VQLVVMTTSSPGDGRRASVIMEARMGQDLSPSESDYCLCDTRTSTSARFAPGQDTRACARSSAASDMPPLYVRGSAIRQRYKQASPQANCTHHNTMPSSSSSPHRSQEDAHRTRGPCHSWRTSLRCFGGSLTLKKYKESKGDTFIYTVKYGKGPYRIPLEEEA
jgi:hypothetical protein